MAGTSKRVIKRPEPLIPGRQFDPMVGQQRVTDRRSYKIMRENSVGALSNLSDVQESSPAIGDVLTWNGAHWVNSPDVDPASGNVTYEDLQANRPGGAAGDLFFPSDGYHVQRKGASVWVPWGPGAVLEPDPASFAWENQGTATLITTNGAMTIKAVGQNASALRVQEMAAPGSTPWTVTAQLQTTGMMGRMVGYRGGLIVRDSVGGKCVTFYLMQGSLWISKFLTTNAGGPAAEYWPGGYGGGGVEWLQISDDGTNLFFRTSGDGINYQMHGIILRHDYMAAGPDRVGFFCDTQGSVLGVPYSDMFCTCLSWRVT